MTYLLNPDFNSSINMINEPEKNWFFVYLFPFDIGSVSLHNLEKAIYPVEIEHIYTEEWQANYIHHSVV